MLGREYEEYWRDDPDTVVDTCELCGNRKSVRRMTHPFVAEGIRDPTGDDDRWMCYECYKQLKYDV